MSLLIVSVPIVKHFGLWNKELSSGVTRRLLPTEGCVGSFPRALPAQGRKGGIRVRTSGVTRVSGLLWLPPHHSNSTQLSNEPTRFMSLNSKQRLRPNSLDLWCDQKPPPFLIFLRSKEN